MLNNRLKMHNLNTPDLGNLLTKIRERVNFTQIQLAELIGVSGKTVSNWETGSNYPSAKYLKKLITLYLGRQAFSVGKELAEAKELWVKAQVNSAFDENWFLEQLANTKNPTAFLKVAPKRAVESLPNDSFTNLPAPLTQILGREQEIAKLCQQLAQPNCRLLTISGIGGVGKTRLAIAVAQQLLPLFPGSVFFINLADLTNPAMVIYCIAETVGLTNTDQDLVIDNLKNHLKNRPIPTLLVLDNFEHLLPASTLIYDLLVSLPGLKIIITSRIILNLYGEHCFNLKPLPLPFLETETEKNTDLKKITESAAVSLALERISLTGIELAPTQENILTVAKICIHLEGLPLAIELAAAKLKFITLQSLLHQLSQRFELEETEMIGIPERHRTLKKTIEWSYNLLSKAEKIFFRRAGIFQSAWSAEAAQVILNFDQQLKGNQEKIIHQLIRHSLLNLDIAGGGNPRYFLLKPLQEFCLEKLVETRELAELEQACFSYYLAFCEKYSPKIEQPNLLDATNMLALEHHNIRAALDWALENQETGQARRLGIALTVFWWQRGYFQEGRYYLERTLQSSVSTVGKDTNAEEIYAKTLYSLSYIAAAQSDYQAAEEYAKTSLAFFQKSGNKNALALVLLGLGRIYIDQTQHDFAEAKGLLAKSLSLFRDVANLGAEGMVLNCFAQIAFHEKQSAQAVEILRESLQINRQAENRFGIATACSLLGNAMLASGKLAEAEMLSRESLNLFCELDFQSFIPVALLDLAVICVLQGNYTEAKKLLAESLTQAFRQGNRRTVADGLSALAGLLAFMNQTTNGAIIAGAVSKLREQINSPLLPAYHQIYEMVLNLLTMALEKREFEAAWQKGRNMELFAVLDLGLAGIV